MVINLTGRHIDNSWYWVGASLARALCIEACEAGMGSTMVYPKPGRERRVLVNKCIGWLARTTVNGKTVWAVHGLDLVKK